MLTNRQTMWGHFSTGTINSGILLSEVAVTQVDSVVTTALYLANPAMRRAGLGPSMKTLARIA